MAIKSFDDGHAETIFNRSPAERFGPDIAKAARRKLVYLDAAARLGDLASPSSNKLEALKKDRLGQHGIRVNDQFRICFRWREGNAYDVELTDYH